MFKVQILIDSKWVSIAEFDKYIDTYYWALEIDADYRIIETVDVAIYTKPK